MITLAKLLVQNKDLGGYITYVFEDLDKVSASKYIMCVRYPNWETRFIKAGEVGYLHFEEIIAGQDKWYDGNKMIPYRYDHVQFVNFISKEDEIDKTYTM